MGRTLRSVARPATAVSKIGVAVTTYGRPQTLTDTLAKIRKHTPDRIPVVVVDDGSVPACPHATYRFPENRGIAAAKNKCLEILADELGCEHLFLFDSDTFPVCDDWWKSYVDSSEPHLMYQFPTGPAHWTITETFRGDDLVAYDKPRGCMIYTHRSVLDVVGGMHLVYGKHGGEHGNWSDRIFQAGLTSHRYADVTIKTVECLDEKKKIISSIDCREHQHWKHVDASTLPQFAQYREQPIPVLVPRRPDQGHRDQLWKHVTTHFWDRLPKYRIVEGEHLEGAFNRAAALNRAAKLAGNWDVCVIADADAWVPIPQLNQAVTQARATGKLVSALTSVVEFDQESTDRILGGDLLFDVFGIERVRTDDLLTQSLMLACPRTLFDRVGGFDEHFQGWGAEDNAFWKAATIIVGAPERIDGAAFHLWHAPNGTKESRRRDPEYQRNWRRYQQYQKARTEADLKRLRCSR